MASEGHHHRRISGHGAGQEHWRLIFVEGVASGL
jgi:hypothetical protein